MTSIQSEKIAHVKHLSGKELKAGMTVNTWFGSQTIIRIEPYIGIYSDFICGIMVFGFRNMRMSIETTAVYEVVGRENL